jgi:hypothetical protein
MYIAGIEIRSVVDTHGQYDGAVPLITVGALRLLLASGPNDA